MEDIKGERTSFKSRLKWSQKWFLYTTLLFLPSLIQGMSNLLTFIAATLPQVGVLTEPSTVQQE
jgi:hypothetical protein